jgi:hypothetical protein
VRASFDVKGSVVAVSGRSIGIKTNVSGSAKAAWQMLNVKTNKKSLVRLF